jgi:hypothetical protein
MCFLLDLLRAFSRPLHHTRGMYCVQNTRPACSRSSLPLPAQISHLNIANAPHSSALKAHTRSLILDTFWSSDPSSVPQAWYYPYKY